MPATRRTGPMVIDASKGIKRPRKRDGATVKLPTPAPEPDIDPAPLTLSWEGFLRFRAMNGWPPFRKHKSKKVATKRAANKRKRTR